MWRRGSSSATSAPGLLCDAAAWLLCDAAAWLLCAGLLFDTAAGRPRGGNPSGERGEASPPRQRRLLREGGGVSSTAAAASPPRRRRQRLDRRLVREGDLDLNGSRGRGRRRCATGNNGARMRYD
jgi:hypothetical protein